MSTVLSGNQIDKMFMVYPDVWDFIKYHYSKYREVPDVSELAKKFDNFDIIETTGPTQYFVDQMREQYTKNELGRITLKVRDNISKISSERVLSGAIKELMALQDISIESHDLDITDFEGSMEEYKLTKARSDENGGTPGIRTGIDVLDSAYPSGLVGGDLVVVLGWTGRAKSLLTTYVCCNAFNEGYRPMIISLEMRTAKVRDRAYTMLGNGMFKNSDLTVGAVNEDDFRTFSNRYKNKSGFIVVSHDGNNEVTPAMVQSKIDQHKPQIIVLDYAQLMSDNANSSDMTSRMRNMSKEYKRLAVKNDIPIILISSATPDATTSINTPPIIEQVAWSKQLSYDADLAFAVHRHDAPLGDNCVLIEIAGRKNRNGDLFSGYFKANINEGIYEEFSDLESVQVA